MAYDVGIIVLNYNSFGDVKECVKSIKETSQSNYHIYIIDNQSTDDSWLKLNESYASDDKVTLILSPRNGGYSAGNNYAWEYAKKDGCKYIYISNTDIIYYEGAIDRIFAFLEQLGNENIAVCGPSIDFPYAENAESARSKLTFKTFLLNKKPLWYIGKGKYSNREKPIEYNENGVFVFTGMVSGCSFMIRADVFEEIGGFDDNVFLFGEEDIMAYKLEERQNYTAILREARILHNHNKTISSQGSAFSKYYYWLSPMYVLKKYAKINKAQAIFLYMSNVVVWASLALFREDFRKKLKAFSTDNKRYLEL